MFRTKRQDVSVGHSGLIWRALRTLGRDERGNTLAIVAASVIPILGVIGGGLDMARAYATKTKLQSACDASALAARRQMAGGQLDQAAIDEGTRFFNFNFPAGTMQAKPVDLKIEANKDDASTVDVSASTAVPTTIMALFGKKEIALDIQCSADQDYVNNDIMLVLDVTGSMNCKAGSGKAYCPTEESLSRLSRVKDAAAALYRALEGAKGVRTRYGFMPYSMTVSVGGDLNQAWITDTASYWTKSGSNWNFTPVTHSAAWFSNTWQGCIEERSTISQNGQSDIRISTDVAQADIDTVSTSDVKLKWRPYDDTQSQREDGTQTIDNNAVPANNLEQFCPARATKLDEYDSESAFQAKVNSSLARVGGYTNHDLGMMWGMRYLSGSGMFAAENPDKVDEIPVRRHIIFLTDGDMTADTANYNAYGINQYDNRFVGTGNLEAKHKSRFLNACDRAREMGMTVWVIALDDESVAEEVKPCASGEDHFFVSDGSDLDKVFDIIGKGIGHLRLTK